DMMISSTMRQLEITKRQALKLASAKSEFLSNMSHEIRTPLNGMLGFTDILLKDEYSPEKTEYLTHIRSSGNFLMGIIGNILDLSKIEHGSMSIENRCFDIRKELKVMSLFSGKCTENRITYLFSIGQDVPQYIIGDSLRLTQILNNIVGNAIKFTPKGGNVSLNIGVTDAGDALHFEVIDSGIGISEQDQKNIFSPFTQSNVSIGRQYGGSGLGLSISQKLLELMGSELGLDSRQGEGSRFYFKLPLQNCDCEIDSAQGTQKLVTKKQQLKILVVEDDKISQKMVAALLKRLGHTVTVVDDGQDVMPAFENDSFDLVLMDIRMPIMNGVEATRLLRQQDVDIPIIALTANVFKDDIESYLSAGMNTCLSKPIDIDKLEQVIEQYVAHND
ncbi:MAG: ATP-binding protein, partial [Gammaproteobacteria bacterium]|nr:ATP-binding protein [Gammaproteobacteria bacterium]